MWFVKLMVLSVFSVLWLLMGLSVLMMMRILIFVEMIMFVFDFGFVYFVVMKGVVFLWIDG